MLTKKTTERHSGSEAGKVDEDNGGKALKTERILYVTGILCIPPPHVFHKTTEAPTCPQQSIVLTFLIFKVFRIFIAHS